VPLNLIKLCVGCDTVEELLAWRANSSRTGDPWLLSTRQTPKRAPELLEGGSLYRVYRGVILSRQRILDIRTVAEEGRKHCAVVLDEAVVRTVPTRPMIWSGSDLREKSQLDWPNACALLAHGDSGCDVINQTGRSQSRRRKYSRTSGQRTRTET